MLCVMVRTADDTIKYNIKEGMFSVAQQGEWLTTCLFVPQSG